MHDHGCAGDGPVATADERRNIAGLELLHAFFRDDSLARTKGEPIAMWLVRFNEQLGKVNRVDIDIVTSLPDVAVWQALNLAGLPEDRIERVVSWLPDDTFTLDTELPRLCDQQFQKTTVNFVFRGPRCISLDRLASKCIFEFPSAGRTAGVACPAVACPTQHTRCMMRTQRKVRSTEERATA